MSEQRYIGKIGPVGLAQVFDTQTERYMPSKAFGPTEDGQEDDALRNAEIAADLMNTALAAAEQRVGELEDALKQISIMYNDTNYQTMGELTEGMRAAARAALNRLEE